MNINDFITILHDIGYSVKQATETYMEFQRGTKDVYRIHRSFSDYEFSYAESSNLINYIPIRW